MRPLHPTAGEQAIARLGRQAVAILISPLLRAGRHRSTALLLAAGLLGCAVLLAAAPAPRQATPQSLVLITLDTTRADHLGAWGWPHARTPHLDALARRGTRFVRCDSAAPITLPSHATILTGLYPPRHGVRDNGTFVLADRFDTVAEKLAARGWDTAAVVSAVVLGRRHGLAQGFRIYDDDLGAGYAAGTEVSERQAEATTAAALAAAGRLAPPFFLWVHYFDPHEEYRPPTRFADAAQAAGGPHRLYDGEIAYMDDQIGRLLAGLPADVRVAVVGDHGEMLGDHGEDQHGLLLFRGARRVPLILAGPGIPAGRREECLVRTADVAPTLLALAGAPVPAGLDGATLVGATLLGRKVCGRTSYSESFLPFFAYKWFPLRALSDDRFLYLYAPRAAAHLARLLRGRRQNAEALRVLDAALAAGSHEEQVFEEGGHALAALGRLADALRDFRESARRNPLDPAPLENAAQVAYRLGQPRDAVQLYERLLQIQPNRLDIWKAAGALYLDLDDGESAQRCFRRALTLEIDPAEREKLEMLLRELGG